MKPSLDTIEGAELKLVMAPHSERLGSAHQPLAGGLTRPDMAFLLLVDNDATRRRALGQALGGEGFSMLVADSGAQAFGLLHGHAVDAIVLAADLPQRGGEQTTERIKADEGLRDVVVLVLGDAGDDHQRKQMLRAGAEEFLPRDVDSAELALRLRNLIRLRAGARELQRRNAALSQLLHEESQRAAYFDQFTRNLLDAAPDQVVVVDGGGHLVAVNQAWQDFMRELGLDDNDSGVGRPYRPDRFVAEPADAARLLDQLRSSAGGAPGPIVLEYRCERPRTRWFRARFTRFEDALSSYVMIAHEDVTQQHELDGALATTAEELEASRAQVLHAQKMESIGRLVGGVAHDFNNMLTSIICFTRFVVDEMAAEDPRRADLVEVLRAADSAARLTNQLLTFSRRRPVQVSVIDINASLLSIGRVLRRMLGETIELVVLPLDEAAYVMCDAGQLDQLMFNLAIHARDQMLPRGGTISFKLGALADDAEYVELTVADTGPGLSPAAAGAAFEPFSPGATSNAAGGLGLATCASIVQQASGRISIDSELGRGTTFRVLLPRVADPRRADALRQSGQAQPGLSGTALVVEDQPAILRTMSRALKSTGLTVLEASSGEDAIAVLRSRDRLPELVVTDMMLPGMSGVHLVEQLRASSPELRVVFVSGYAGDEPAQSVRVDEKTAFVAKPFTGRQLISRASALLASVGAAQSAERR